MSPLKAHVIINDCINTISISVGKPTYGPSRKLNVYLISELDGVKPTQIGQYVASGLVDSYGLVRCMDDELVPVARCLTLAGCQAAALSDFIRWSGLELVSED